MPEKLWLVVYKDGLRIWVIESHERPKCSWRGVYPCLIRLSGDKWSHGRAIMDGWQNGLEITPRDIITELK